MNKKELETFAREAAGQKGLKTEKDLNEFSQMLQIHIVVLVLDKGLNPSFKAVRRFIGWRSAGIAVNHELNADVLVALKIPFNRAARLIQELGRIGNADLALSDFNDNIHDELGFGIQNNHPSNLRIGSMHYSENH